MLRWRSSVQQLRIFLVLLSIIPGEIVLYGSMFKSPRQRHLSRASAVAAAATALHGRAARQVVNRGHCQLRAVEATRVSAP